MSAADSGGGGTGSWSWWGSLGGLAGDPSGPHTSKQQRRKLAAAGFQKVPGTRGQSAVWIGPNGQVIRGQKQAIKMVRYLNKISGVPQMPPGQWDDMVSPPRASTPPFIPPLNIPGVPPFDIAKLPGWGSVFARVGGLVGAVGLLWPTEAGRGSDLRDYYSKNKPRPAYPGGRGRRRPGRQATRPRRRPRPSAAPPMPPIRVPGRPQVATAGGRGKAQYLPSPKVLEHVLVMPPTPPPMAVPSSRAPGATTIHTGGAATPATFPSSSSSPAIPSSATPTISTVGTSAPAGIPTTWQGWLDYAWSKGEPYLGQYLDKLLGTQPATQPKLKIALQQAPLTDVQPSALTYAPSSVSSQDCSCAKTKRRRRKSCRNPVTKRKRETRGGHRFVTITKRLDCERGKAA